MRLLSIFFSITLMYVSETYAAYYPINFNNASANAVFWAASSSVTMPSVVPAEIGGINSTESSTSGTSWCAGSPDLCANYVGKYPFFAVYTPYPRIGTFNGYNLYQATPTVGFYIPRTDFGDISGTAFAFNAWSSNACTDNSSIQICQWFSSKAGVYSTRMTSYYPVKFVLLKKPANGKIVFPSGVLIYEWRGLRDNNNTEKIQLPSSQAIATYTSNVGTIDITNAGCTVSPSVITLDHGVLSPGTVAGAVTTKQVHVLCQDNAEINLSLVKPGENILYSSLNIPLSQDIYSSLNLSVTGAVTGTNGGYDYDAIGHVSFQVSLSSVLAKTAPVTTTVIYQDQQFYC
ncbi:hypothetical protein ORF62_004565 [Salmonella enterica]|nr:hypothetical protein [Salmonella enterica]